jgi:phage-related protein (TIGR01555 family)
MTNTNTNFMDGYINVNKKIGTSHGVLHSTFSQSVMMDEVQREEYFSNDGLLQTIVTAPVNDAFLTGISADDKIKELFKSVKKKIIEVVSMARVYGGAWLYVKDGKYTVLTPSDLNFGSIEMNPLRDDFLEPVSFSLSITGEILEKENLISVTTFATNKHKLNNEGLGVSVVDLNVQNVITYRVALSQSVDIVGEMNQNVIKMNGLNELIEDEREDDLLQRLEFITQLKSNNSILLIDKEDDYVNVTKSVAGVRDLIKEYAVAICAVAKIPYTRLFRQTVGGLSTSNQGDLTNYYDTVVADIREYYVEPIFNQILEKEGLTGEWSFEQIEQDTREEKAGSKKLEIENVGNLIDLGLIEESKAKELLKI